MNCANSYWAILAVVILGSCQVRTYVQPTPNAPLLEAKKDFRVSANIQVRSKGHNGAQFQSSYSPFKNIGVQLNSYFAESEDETSIYDWDDHKFGMRHFEGGIGYYRTFGDFYLSYYLGYGGGYFNQVNSFNEALSSDRRTLASYGKYEKAYHQIGIWTLAEPWFSLGLSFRNDFNLFREYAYLDFIEFDNGIEQEDRFFEHSAYQMNLLTLILSLRYNLSEHFALSLYFGSSNPYSGESFHESLSHGGIRFTFQINYGKRVLNWYEMKRLGVKEVEDFYK